ncbi:MAG: iron-containing redox enzyme family protein [Acidobacteria bacterium]|nr:iron-containing redox enzyme family protein [Acidobacteriota bacterium]
MRKISQPREYSRHPLIRHLQAGTFNQEHLTRFATALWGMAEAFPNNLARVLTLCPDRTTRRHLLQNLLEEEGFSPTEGTLQDRPERAHIALYNVFIQAVERYTHKQVPAPNPAGTWFTQALDQANWIGPAAYFMVGMELNVPPTFSLLIPLLKQQFSFTDEDLVFFNEHLEADVAHGEIGIQILQAVCQDERTQALAVEGARRGALAWWSFWRYPK